MMATLLVLVIFVAYVGLGVPDSLFGTAWPAIYPEFGIPISSQSAVTILVSCGTVFSSLMSGRLINRWGTGIVTAISTSVTAIALLGFAFSNHLIFLCLSAIPLGLGAGAIDVAQNNYVATHYNARIMSWLHCFYGVGVALSPFLMSFGIKLGDWRTGYLFAFAVQATISIVTIVAIPLWKKVHPNQTVSVEEAKERNVSIFKLAKVPAVRATWLIFIFSCGIESVCTSWGSTFLVESKGVNPAISAQMVALYFVGLTLGRFVSGLIANKVSAWKIICVSCALQFVAIVLLVIPVNNVALACIGLFFTGFAIGPMYPNMTYLTPIHFGEKLSQAVIGSQMAITYVSVMLSPLLFGLLAEVLGTDVFPYFLMAYFLLFTLSVIALKMDVRKGKTVLPNGRI